jgi:DNA-binding transcriptional ArsR family regulator
MEYARPVEALIPGAQGRLLAALLRAGDPVSIRRLASLARVSPNRTSELVDYLLRLGLVDRRDVGRSALVGLAQDSPVVEALRRVENLREETLTRWRYLARDLPHQVTALGVYGSWARGESTIDSDLDLVAVLGAGLGGEVEDRTPRTARARCPGSRPGRWHDAVVGRHRVRRIAVLHR